MCDAVASHGAGAIEHNHDLALDTSQTAIRRKKACHDDELPGSIAGPPSDRYGFTPLRLNVEYEVAIHLSASHCEGDSTWGWLAGYAVSGTHEAGF